MKDKFHTFPSPLPSAFPVIQTAIVEDSPQLLEILTATFMAEHDFNIVLQAETAEAALTAPNWSETNVLLVDLGLPGLSGLELISLLKERFPHLLVLVMTGFRDRETILEALRNGASGYILKTEKNVNIPRAIRSLLSGGSFISPPIAREIVDHVRTSPRTEMPSSGTCLSRRENEILRHLNVGWLYKEIANELGISTHTVHSHTRKIYSKLKSNGREEALRRARMLRIL